MADLNANINVGIETTQALNQLKALQRQISQFHQSVAKSSGEAAVAQRDLQRNFLNSVNSIQGFSAELKTVRTTAESFTNSLEKNKFSMREYFRYAAGATKTFGKNFAAEFSTIEKTAIERVKTLQTQYIKMGRDASGAMQAIAIRPTVLDMKDLGTQTAITAQKQVLFNQLVKQGSTNLLNFGKNTQWAGRQLMVGFTLPLATLGITAGRVFMDMEKAAIKFRKVYGDLFTPEAERQKALEGIVELGEAYTSYGVAVSDSLSMAADAAAAGFAGVDLQNQTAAALKLSVLGQLDLQKALETTISLQNAFQLSSADLAGEIDFLNAVENQTVVALDDITEAVPRVAPVIKQLGGDVRDLAFFLAAMKEGGINAAQGANALKSGLASLINPSEKAALMLSDLGINIRSIISQNQGDIAGTVFNFAKALDNLDPLRRAQAIEQLFGKFQFARISALFDNITREGTQAQRVLELAGSSMQELATLSEDELAVSAASSMNKFRSAVEKIKVALVPIGQIFLEIATPFVEFGTKVLDAFNSLPDGMKKAVGTIIAVLGGIGPVALMTFGLINNGIANMIKFFATVRLGYLKITGQAKGVGDETQYMTQEQLEAAAAAASLDQAHAGLTQRFTAEKTAVDQLRIAYQRAAEAGAKFALNNPQMIRPGFGGTQAQGFAEGGVIRGPGNGTSDSIPALLSNGEAVIPAKQVKKYAPLIEGLIAGNLPGFAKGFLGMPKSAKSVSKNREAADAIYQEFLKSSYAGVAPTEYGHQISPTSGHSFPIFGLGGVYQKGDKRVFVKPVMDETAALAEIRGTQITRQAHGLEAPEQRIVVIRDPMDPTRQRRFLALESDLDAKFIQNEPKAIFNEEQYFRQLVASLVRVDKDLAAGNVFGNVVADVGPAGVFSRASGPRALTTDLPSMEEQALINLLGIKGGAKRAFAESTLGLMAGLTPQQYHQRMLGEIQRVLPALKQTVAGFGLTNPAEADAYNAMIKRLELGLGVDWSKFHSVHSGVKIAAPKKPKAAVGYANGVVSVPGPKGKGDVVPAMLSPGEAVIPAKFAKKYAPLIQAMVAGNIPGYVNGTDTVAGGVANIGGSEVGIANKASARALEIYYNKLLQLNNTTDAVDKMFAQLLQNAERNSDGLVILTKAQAEQAAKANAEIKTSQGSGLQMGHLQTVSKILPSGERESGSFVRGMLPSQNKSLDQGGQFVEDFIRDWNMVTGGLFDAVKLGGAELTDGVKAAAEQIDNDIRDIAVSLAQGGKVTDEILSTAADQALANAKARGGDSSVAANALEKTKDMKVILPATVESLASSDALKTLKEKYKKVGVDFAKLTSNQLKDILLEEKLITPKQTKGGRTDYVTTEAGAALTSRGAGSRLFRTSSDGDAVAVERFAKEEGSKTYLKIKEKMATLVGQVKDEIGTGLDDASGAKSPSVKIAQATENIVDGVKETLVNSKDDVALATEQMISPITKPTQAGKDSASRSAFGNIDVKEPVPAVGNAPRQVVQAMSQETTAARTFAGDLKASFASARANITREMGFVKEEFGSVVQQIKQKFGKGGQEIVAVAQQTNQGLIVGGKEYGFNAIAQAQGRDGAIEAIVTRKTAEIISKATEAYNAGARFVPGLITDGLKSGFPEIEFAGERISNVLAKSIGRAAPKIPDFARPGDPKGMQGPKPQSGFSKAMEGFDSASQGLSNFAFGLSAVSGILSLMGGPLQGFAQGITMLTSGMFALIQIIAAIRALEIKSLVVKTQKLVADRLELALKAKSAVATGAATIGTMAFGTTIWSAVAGLIAFLGPVLAIGLAIAAVAGTFMLVNHVLAENQKKINGLGDAAFATAEKLQNIAELVGFEPTREVDRATQLATVEGMDAAGVARAASIRESEQFQDLKTKESSEGGFKNDIAAIRDADPERAQAALDNLALQLLALAPEGTDPKKIQEYVAAIAMEAGKEDLDLSFVLTVDLSDPAAFDQIVQKSQTALAGLQAVSKRGESELKAYGSQASATYEALNTGLLNGALSTEQYTTQTNELLSGISTLGEDATVVLDKMFANIGIPKETVDGIDNLDARVAILKAAMAGVTGLEETAKELEAANGDAAKQQIILTGLEKKRAAAVKFTSETQERLNQVQKETNNKAQATALEEYLEKAREDAALKKELEANGYSAADAQLILSNEMLKGAYATAVANGTLEEYNKQLAEFKKFEGAASGGAGGSNPIQDAIDNLKKQRTEILNTSKAYGALRKSGMDAQKAFEFAQNPDLMSAMNAGLKVGSKQWDEIIKRIKAAEAATKKWQKSTVQGQTELFRDVAGKVSDYFSAQEELLQATFEVNTAANQGIVDTLEKQIEGFNSKIQEYSSDLDDISEKEELINAQYDKKIKALEQTKKINEDILRQQKSQLSIADALSQGDVAGAASAMQELRSQNAASALDAQGNQLELARSAQLAGVTTKDGLTRAEIEKKIKDAKKEIAIIENGSLKTAKDAIAAAEEKLQKDIKGLSYAGQTQAQWTLQSAAIGAAEAKAVAFNSKAKAVLKTVTDIVAQWNALGTKAPTPTPPPAPKPKDKKADGGFVSGPGTATSDSIPAMLSDGEYVVKASSVSKFGKGFLDKINSGTAPKFKMAYANGGMVKMSSFKNGGLAMPDSSKLKINSRAQEGLSSILSDISSIGLSSNRQFNPPVYPQISRTYASENIGGGLYANTSTAESSTQVDNSVYNYNLSVNVEGTDASPDQIANVVMRKLQSVGSQRVRGQVVR